MLLQKLKEYGQFRIPQTPPMYKELSIRWIFDLDGSGKLLGVLPTSSGENKKKDRGKIFLVPHVARSSGVKARLLVDTAEYVFGIPKDPEKSKPERVAQCREAFRTLIETASESVTEEPIAGNLKVVANFLRNADPALLTSQDSFDPTDNITFRVDGSLPFESEPVQEFWARHSLGDEDKGNKTKPASEMQCIVCGKVKTVEESLPFTINLIAVGGQGKGNAIISANKAAFESYGLQRSLIAPTCAHCGELFSKAANSLIDGDSTHIDIGNLRYIFWTREESKFSVAMLLKNPSADQVKSLFETVFNAKTNPARFDKNPFYCTAFSASGARVAVRDWIDTTVGNVQEHLLRYFQLQEMTDWDGSDGKPYGIYALASATVRDARKELPLNTVRVLLRMGLSGGPLPPWLRDQTIKRVRAEQRVTRPHAALLKMVICSQPNSPYEEKSMSRLDNGNHDPAYLCGRLLAVLESIQKKAISGIQTTVVDRFYGGVSTAPANVFGLLIGNAQDHLKKLRASKETEGAANALDKRIEEILEPMKNFPGTLKMSEQALFALGFYHQRAWDRQQAIEHSKKKGDTTPPETDPED